MTSYRRCRRTTPSFPMMSSRDLPTQHHHDVQHFHVGTFCEPTSLLHARLATVPGATPYSVKWEVARFFQHYRVGGCRSPAWFQGPELTVQRATVAALTPSSHRNRETIGISQNRLCKTAVKRRGDSILDEMQRVQSKAWELLGKMESEGDHRGSVVALREVRNAWTR
jgi:hypothetical protein